MFQISRLMINEVSSQAKFLKDKFSTAAIMRTKTRDKYPKHEASIRPINQSEHLKAPALMESTSSNKSDVFMYGGAVQVTLNTHETLIGDTKYKNLPVIYIKSTRNNTIATLVDGTSISAGKSRVLYSSSCGAIGFKNARKGTTVASQTLGTAFGEQLIKRKITDVRTVVKGLGPGRLSILKGLVISGINIVSITDNTFLYGHTDNLNRPRKIRRL